MTRKLLLLTAALLAILGLTALPASAGGHPQSLTADAAHRSPPVRSAIANSCTISNFCGFWNDDYGSGFAASPPPNAHLQGGVQIFSIGDNQGAWRVNEFSSDFCGSGFRVTDTCPFEGNAAWENGILEGSPIIVLCPHADISLCYKDDNNAVDLASFNTNARDQMWVQHNSYFYNVSATDANSSGNPQPMTNPSAGSQIITCNINCAAVGHQSWALSSGAAPRPRTIKLAAYSVPLSMTGRSCSISVKVTHGPGTTNAKINQGCGEKIRAWETFSGSAGTQDGPWKTSGTSTAWYNTPANPYTGGYQRMQSNGTVHTITTF